MAEIAETPTSILTDEQKSFLQMCEEKFADRFTEKDEEFMKVYNEEASTPPIMPNWNEDRRRNYRRNGPRNNYHNHRRDSYGDRDYNNYDRHRDYSDRRQYDSYGYGNSRGRYYADRR